MGIRLEVTYNDHQMGYFHVPEDQGWRIDSATRMIIIGTGVPRKLVPLDSVQMVELINE